MSGLAQVGAGPPRGGTGGYNDPGAHGLWGGSWASGRPLASAVKTFFFGDHSILTEKTVRISVKTFFEIS